LDSSTVTVTTEGLGPLTGGPANPLQSQSTVRLCSKPYPTTRAKKDDCVDGTVAQGVRGGTIPRSKQWKVL
jgi:hypothetical protein